MPHPFFLRCLFYPSSDVPIEGVYRCAACGAELVLRVNELFPHHAHHLSILGQVRWRLIYRVQQQPLPSVAA